MSSGTGQPEAIVTAAHRPDAGRLLGRIVDIVGDAVVAVDGDHRIIVFNHGAQVMFGYSADEMLGLPLSLLLPAEVRDSHAAWVEAFACEGTSTRRMASRGAVEGVRRDGTRFPAGATIAHFELDGEPVHVAVVRDISEHVATREHLAASLREQQLLALTDSLTGLRNRRGFCRALERELEVLHGRGTVFALVYIDLDDFKPVNDRFGHRFGDHVLCEVARHLQQRFRALDTIARIGGDEFAVLSPDSEGSDVGPRIERLREALQADMAGLGVAITLSAGILTCRPGAADADACLHEADRLMYRVKHATRDAVAYGEYGRRRSGDC